MAKKMKVLMMNFKTGVIIATLADVNKPVYQKYIKEGFCPIGHADGFNLYVGGLVQTFEDHRTLLGINKPIKKEILVEAVSEQIKEDVGNGDVEAIEELLSFVPLRYLLGYLPEEKAKEFL